mmetsp:Transcript_18833/g.54499  ORF Transcript_18833/g.54499 Transcript_18833/m.54499 type:complete len:353 (+) Transcript_18833:136-1194(+)
MATQHVSVTLFTSIPDVAEELLRDAPDLPLKIVTDPGLSGHGGTINFDPTLLSARTHRILADAVVLIAEPSVVAKLLRNDAGALPRLKWCQSTYAGVDSLFKELVPNNVPWKLTRFAGVFGPPIAEWCIARIIAHERDFAATSSDQARKEWAGSGNNVTSYRYLSTLTLSVLGCGDIGRCVARAGRAMGMRTVGFARTAADKRPGGSNLDAVEEWTSDLNMALREADYVVSVLPSTLETRGLLRGEALAPASRDAGGNCPVFLNVGRGDVIDESSLIVALNKEYISAAILDVFEKEPLPKESPLWGRADVVISPHVSGVTQARDVPELFIKNYRRFISGEKLLYEVDWLKGY